MHEVSTPTRPCIFTLSRKTIAACECGVSVQNYMCCTVPRVACRFLSHAQTLRSKAKKVDQLRIAYSHASSTTLNPCETVDRG